MMPTTSSNYTLKIAPDGTSSAPPSVPEPSTGLLFFSGIGIMIALERKQMDADNKS